MTYKLPPKHPERRQLQRLFQSDDFDRAHYAQLKRQILGRGSIFDATPEDLAAIVAGLRAGRPLHVDGIPYAK